MDDRQRLRGFAAGAALRYWRSLLRKVHSGRDLAGENRWRFLATTERSRSRLAREFYRSVYLAKLASLERGQVLEHLSSWLDSAIDFTLGWNEDEPAEQRQYLTHLVRKQYVVRIVQDYREDGTTVEGYPNDEVLYGDLYEMSAAGVSQGGVMYLCNSTGEPFTSRDRRVTFKGMRQDFFANAASDGCADDWEFEWLSDHDDDRVIAVTIFPNESKDLE